MKNKVIMMLCLICAACGIGMTASAEKISWIDYEDFSAWSESAPDWVNGEDTSTAEIAGGEDPYIKIKAGSSASAMTRIINNAPDSAKALLADEEAGYKLLIKARFKADETDSASSGVPAEISFAAGTSTKQRLINLNSASSGTITLKIHNKTNVAEVSAGEWINAVIVGDIADGAGEWTYFINGVRYDGYSYLPASAGVDAIQLATRAKVSGGYDDVEVYLITEDTLPSVSLVKSDAIEVGEAIVLNFTSETALSLLTDGSVTLNGSVVDESRIEVGADAKTVSILPDSVGWEPDTEYEIGFADNTDVFGNTVEDCTLTFKTKAAEKPVLNGKILTWTAYDDISDWEETGRNWTNGTDTSKAVWEDSSYVRVLESSASSGMMRIINTAPQEIQELFAGTDSYKLVIKSRFMPYAIDPDKGSTPIEISFAQGTSTKQRLLNVTGASSGKLTVRVHNEADVDIAAQVGEWNSITVIADITNGTGEWTYYIDDTHCGTYSYMPDGINAIQFATRGIASGCFDDIEIYAVTGGETEFSATGIPVSVEAENNIAVVFNADLRVSGIPAGAITINGAAVSADRITVGADGRTLMIAPENGMWLPGEAYSLRISSAVTNIFGTRLSAAIETEIESKGESFIVSEPSLTEDGEQIKAEFSVINVSGSEVPVYMIIMLCNGTAEEYMVKAAKVSKLGIESSTQAFKAEEAVEIADVDFAKLMLVRADTLAPVTDSDITLDLRG